MKRTTLGRRTIVCMTACALLGGCAGKNVNNETTVQESVSDSETEQEENDQKEISAEEVVKVTAVTEVFGDGQKPSAVILEYPGEIDASSLSEDDFQVENQTVTGIYTNSEAALTDHNVDGNFVVLTFAYENTKNSESMAGGPNREGGPNQDGEPNGEGGPNRDGGQNRGGGPNRDGKPDRDFESDREGDPDGENRGPEGEKGGPEGGPEGEKGGPEGDKGGPGGPEGEKGGPEGGSGGPEGDNGGPGGPGFGGNGQMETDLSVSVAQVGEVLGIDGTVYTGNGTVMENSDTIDLVVQDFQLLEYTDDELGCTIPYSLYLPEDYDESKEYPLVFFVADASANSDDSIRNLTQGNGAIVWAEPAEQAKHECIVLAPQYTNTLVGSIGALTTDDNVWTDGLTLISNLLNYVIDEYGVDENRIYGTGQSQGCMTNIALSDKYPDLFAAQFLVAGQWNVEEMAAMKDKNLWIVVCEGDTKAYPGMNEATESWEALGSSVARSDLWDSTSTPEEFDQLVEEMKAQNCNINYTVFEGGNHNYTWSVAYNIEGIRDWLFEQTKA